MNLGAVIFVPALAGCIIFGFVFSLFAASHYMTVLQSTGAGAKKVTWASEPILDQFWKVWYMAWLIGLWLGPAYFLGRAFAGATGADWMKLVIPLAVFWVCFPVSQLSSLSSTSIWVPLHPRVFDRLVQKPGVVLGFMALSAGALAIWGAGFRLAFFTPGLEWLVVGSLLFVLGGLLYARLLGRLAYVLAYTKSFLARKRKKKKPVESEDGQPREEAAAPDEPEPEPRFEQPSELPPIHTPDEGPLTGYDVKFADADAPVRPRKKTKRAADDGEGRRKRVVAEVAEDEEAEPPAKPKPARVEPDPDDDFVSYGVHEAEGAQPEEPKPSQLLKPNEEEMKLLSRDDVPKPPKQVWSGELLAFLAQPETLAAMGLLSFLCSIVAGMVRIAREFDPTSEG
jgi:hypothetical protein